MSISNGKCNEVLPHFKTWRNLLVCDVPQIVLSLRYVLLEEGSAYHPRVLGNGNTGG